MSLRSVARGALERLATGLGAARLGERAHRDEVAVLSYHNVVPHGERPVGDRSLHVPEATFSRHLDLIEAYYEVVPLDERDRVGRASAPRVVLTFDDAYAGAVSAGLAELARRGLPATVFVPVGLLDRRTFWWDRLAGDDGIVPRERRDHVLWRLAGDDSAVREWMASEGIAPRELPEHARSATAGELSEATASGRVTLGAHGSGHLNFAALDAAALDQELAAPIERLGREFEAYRPFVAYPYGLTSSEVERAAGERYELGFRIDGGLADAASFRDRPRDVPRINVPAGLSPDGLRLRVSGLRR